MRGPLESFDYSPEGLPELAENYKRLFDFPIPYNLDYQITTWSRHPRHDRQILSTLLTSVLTSRYQALEIPEDETVRFLYILNFMKRDRTEQDKRLFCNIFNVRVHSELYLTEIEDFRQVDNVSLTTFGFTQTIEQE